MVFWLVNRIPLALILVATSAHYSAGQFLKLSNVALKCEQSYNGLLGITLA